MYVSVYLYLSAVTGWNESVYIQIGLMCLSLIEIKLPIPAFSDVERYLEELEKGEVFEQSSTRSQEQVFPSMDPNSVTSRLRKTLETCLCELFTVLFSYW